MLLKWNMALGIAETHSIPTSGYTDVDVFTVHIEEEMLNICRKSQRL